MSLVRVILNVNMQSITFIDTEVEPKTKKILSLGAIKGNGSLFRSSAVADFVRFLKSSSFIGGHNILNHDLIYLEKALTQGGINTSKIIDTLFLSPLLFPKKPYHALLKDDKLQTEAVSYTHLRAHETVLDLVCRLL